MEASFDESKSSFNSALARLVRAFTMERLEADCFFWGDLIGEISSVWLSLILASIALTFLSPIVAMRFLEELLKIAKPVSKNGQWLPLSVAL